MSYFVFLFALLVFPNSIIQASSMHHTMGICSLKKYQSSLIFVCFKESLIEGILSH